MSNAVWNIDKCTNLKLVDDASMDGEDSTDLRYCTIEDIPPSLRFCLRFLGLWTGNDACRNGRPITNSKMGNQNMIELQEFTSDINEERQPLLNDSSRSSREKGKDYVTASQKSNASLTVL